MAVFRFNIRLFTQSRRSHLCGFRQGKEKTLEYLDWLLRWADKNSDIPIHVIQNKNLYKDLLNKENSTGQRFVSIPAFTKNEDGSYGMLRRQCTKEYKIEQVDKKIT